MLPDVSNRIISFKKKCFPRITSVINFKIKYRFFACEQTIWYHNSRKYLTLVNIFLKLLKCKAKFNQTFPVRLLFVSLCNNTIINEHKNMSSFFSISYVIHYLFICIFILYVLSIFNPKILYTMHNILLTTRNYTVYVYYYIVCTVLTTRKLL